jgi:hypothetical protein
MKREIVLNAIETNSNGIADAFFDANCDFMQVEGLLFCMKVTSDSQGKIEDKLESCRLESFRKQVSIVGERLHYLSEGSKPYEFSEIHEALSSIENVCNDISNLLDDRDGPATELSELAYSLQNSLFGISSILHGTRGGLNEFFDKYHKEAA